MRVEGGVSKKMCASDRKDRRRRLEELKGSRDGSKSSTRRSPWTPLRHKTKRNGAGGGHV